MDWNHFRYALGTSLAIFSTLLLEALPSVSHVAYGTAEVSSQGNELVIRPSENAILNYKKFDIQSHETVRFEMQNSLHRVLNRVTEGSASSIDGVLLSNGIVYLMNPAGILFGPTCRVDVAGLYAAAAHLSDQDFLLGFDRFKNVQGVIEIYGTLSAQEIALIGRSILQKGTLVAEEGNIFLGTSENIYIGKENNHLFIKCPKEGLQTLEETACFIECGTPESYLLHHSGISRAKKIHLYGEKESLVQVSGSLNADPSQNEGGKIWIQGEVISLEAAHLQASSPQSGGEVLIGGGVHGEGLFPTAKYTLCDAATQIYTDAQTKGDGGTIVLWADKLTGFDAQLFSRGGSLGGNGGYIETSSGLHFHGSSGKVDTSAPKGRWGQWDLDPHSITIVNGPSIPPGLTLADLSDGTSNDYTASATLLESAVSNILLAAVVPNPPGADNTYISLGASQGATPATVNITNPNVGVTFNTQNGVGNGKFYANGSFTTTGFLTFSTPLTLVGDTSLTSTSNAITFSFTIDSAPATNNDLLLNAAAGVIFSQAIGSVQPIGDLTVLTPGANIQCYSNISATGNLSFNSSLLTLNAPCSFATTGGGIEFFGTVNSDTPSSNRNLSLSATGDILFHSFVGLNPLGDLQIANAANISLLSQTNPALPPHTLVARSFTQLAGSGDTNFEGALITFGAPIPQAAGTPPTPPRDGGNVSITTNGAINFYYLVQSGPNLTPVLNPAATDIIAYKSVITTTGGRQSSSVPTGNNPNAPNGLNGGNVTLSGSAINLLGVYAGGTPAFPGTSGTGGKGGTISITSNMGTILRGPIFATGGPGANGGAQVYPAMVYPGQNLATSGGDSPGNITITGPFTLGFNGIILRGSDLTTGDVLSQGSNLLGIDASTAGIAQLGGASNLSYLAIDYSKQATFTGPVQAQGLDLFNAGDGFITFEQPVTSTDIQAIANEFCVIFEEGFSGTSSFLNCGDCPGPPPPPPPPGPPPAPPSPPSPSDRPQGRGFAGVYYPTFNLFGSSGSFLFYPSLNLFNNDDSYIVVPRNIFFLGYLEPPVIVEELD